MQLISRKEVLSRLPFSSTTLWRQERSGQFPKAVRASAGKVGYDADAIDRWIRDQIQRDGDDAEHAA